MKIYRIANKKHANLEGLGGLYTKGRWNKKGHRCIYASQSRSLAAWEKFVGISSLGDLPKNLVIIEISIPENTTIKQIPKGILIDNWDISSIYRPYKKETIKCGTEFLIENKYLVLQVPSAVIKGEYNYLINPNHSEISNCKIESIEAFDYDKRIS